MTLFTLYARPKVHYTPDDEKHVCRVLFVLVPVFYPNLISIYFFFAIFCLGGSGLVLKFEGGFWFPSER